MIDHAYVNSWCAAQFPEHLELLKTLAAIPAPSHQEDLRADFLYHWLHQNGAADVRIDSARNVVLPLGAGTSRLAAMAHTDVVFPDTTTLPVYEEAGRLYAPGVGDDTANVVALMLCVKFFLTHPHLIPEPLLVVFNSCEEGLGNLKGVRQIMQDYGDQIHSLVSFDCQWDTVISRAVGSERWSVHLSTPGGHSFSDFGNPNAIQQLSRLVTQLYSQHIPVKAGCRTTYNVGLISGGTSVNTIAQHAELTYEYRSDDRDCLAQMAGQFHRIVQEAQSKDVHISLKNIGIRPCNGNIPPELHKKLLQRCSRAIYQATGTSPLFSAGSTDANIPLSMGIPAATFGLYQGGGAHTREEFVEISSLTTGLKIALAFFLQETIDNGVCP